MMLVLKTDKIELLQDDGSTRVVVTHANGSSCHQWLSKGVSLDLKIVDAYPTLEDLERQVA